ncbi:hypothetical protein LguiB_029306 [Lonicera macranthoides]
MNVKVRLVICPRCTKLLPEMAEVPLYKCGGCGTVLKAKVRKNDTKDTEPHLHETNPTQESGPKHVLESQLHEKNPTQESGQKDVSEPHLHEADPVQESEPEHVTGDKGTSSLNQQITVPSSNESVSEKSSEERDRCEIGDQNRQINGVNHSDELRNSTDHANVGSSPVAGSNVEAEDNRLNWHDRRDNGNGFRFKKFSDEASLPPLAGPHIEASESESLEQNCEGDRSEFGEDMEVDENLKSLSHIEVNENLKSLSHIEVNESTSLEQNNQGDQIESGEDTKVDENLKSHSHIEVNESKSLEQNDEGDLNEFGEDTEVDENLKNRLHIEVNESKSLEQNDKGGQIEFGEDTEVDENLKNRLCIEVNGSKSLEQNGEGDQSEFVEDTEVGEDLNGSKSLEQNDENNQSDSGEDTEVDENLKRRSISKSSSGENLSDSSRMYSFATAQRSFANSPLYDYLGSPPKEQIKQGQNSILGAFQRVSSTDTLEYIPCAGPSSEVGVTLGDISKSPSTKSSYAYYGSESSGNENEYRVRARHFQVPKRNFKDKGLVNPKGSPQRDEFMMNDHTTTGNKWYQDEFPGAARHVPRIPLYSRGAQAGPSTYGHNKFQYNSISSNEHERPESSKMELLKMVCELQDQLDRKQSLIEAANGRYRYRQGNNWSQPCQINRMAFSGEALHFGHQVDCSCLRCVPQERHYSAQLPRHYMAHPSPTIYSSHRSGSSSPVQYRGSEFSLWSRDNDQWHRDRELTKLNSREKRQPVKRHFRPVASGSPIIACYQCSALLQLPADFLVFKRKCHLLQCNSCSKVLKFSLQNRIHLVQYLPHAIAPPPSEVDKYIDSTEKRKLASASASQESEPILRSVDYGRPSTKGYRFSSLVHPFHKHGSNSDDRKMSSVSSFEPVEERKMSVLNESKNKNKNRSSGSQKTGSPLHRLMGYASPSKVWRLDFRGP